MRRASACLLAVLLLAACGAGPGRNSRTASHPPGTVVNLPSGGFFISDYNEAGNAAELRVSRVTYGRLVEVFGLDATGAQVPMAREYVIGPALNSDGMDYSLETNPVTSRQNLIILRDVTDTTKGGGRDQFFVLLVAAEQNLIPVIALPAGGAGLYSMVPRNSVLVVQFADLIDETTVDSETLRVLTGTPPSLPFEPRLIVDPYHGGLSGNVFHSSRVMVDTTVSEIESFTTSPPLPINTLGLPPSVDVNLPTFELRLPTLLSTSVGQTSILLNLAGHALATTGNGPVDFTSPTVDVVRAARAGGNSNVTGDDDNGFLPDDEAPRIVGTQTIQITKMPTQLGPSTFLVPEIRFTSLPCAQTPDPGDLLVQPGVYAEITRRPMLVQNGVLRNVEVRLVLYPAMWDGSSGAAEWLKTAVGAAEFFAAFDSVDDLNKEVCFARILPLPSGYPDLPSSGMHTSSSFELRFSEAMDPSSVTAFDSLTLTRVPTPPAGAPPISTDQYVVGTVSQSSDLTRFTFLSDLPLAHAVGQAEPYYLRLASGTWSPTDLSGNGIDFTLPDIQLTLDPTAAAQINGGRVSRFPAVDEEAPFGDETKALPEWGGQHLYDLSQELIRPRPVVRSLGTVDRSHPVPALMSYFTLGVQTPLSNYGSKCQTVWRYCDFGLGMTDSSKFNMDLEGLYWSPAAGMVVFDAFPNFEIRLAHSAYVPDEYVNPSTNVPLFGGSGITNFYSKNILDPVEDPLTIVHPRYLGYQINPGELIESGTGSRLMPYPWNRNATQEDWTTYTWRDTALRMRAGKGGGGLDLYQVYFANNKTRPSNPYFKAGQIRSSGLSLLMEYRCFPDDGAVGQNALEIALGSSAAAQPFFRAFTSGGIKQNGKVKKVNPDAEIKANGGFNPRSSPPGAKTPGTDPVVYMGGADFVVRISRSHSLWFSATDPLSGGTFPVPVYSTPITEPTLTNQPPGTSITLAFRGMTGFDPPTDACTGQLVLDPLQDASTLDLYGDHYNDSCIPSATGQPNHSTANANLGITFLNADDNWLPSISSIDGAPYYQVRVTFQSDIFSGLTPSLSALAVSWSQ